MKNLLLICGYSFSGKSTLANKIAKELSEPEVISLDKINQDRGFNISKDINRENWEQTHQIVIEQIKSSISKNLLIDDTNMFKKHRIRFAEAGISVGYVPLTIFIDTPKEVVFKRYQDYEKTERHIPPKEAFQYVLNNFEVPTSDENNIVCKYNSDFYEFLSKLRDRLK